MKVVTDGIASSFSALVLVGWIVGVAAAAAGIRRSLLGGSALSFSDRGAEAATMFESGVQGFIF